MPDVPLGSYQAAANFGDLVILALPWPISLEVLGEITLPDRRILVDVSNPEAPDGRSLDLGHHTSGAEEIARVVPQCRVVKAFSHFYAELLHEDPAFDAGAPSVIYCGDDAEGKECVGRMIDSCGLDAVDAGGLEMARYLEPFAMLTVRLVRDQGWGPTGVAWRLMRRRLRPACGSMFAGAPGLGVNDSGLLCHKIMADTLMCRSAFASHRTIARH